MKVNLTPNLPLVLPWMNYIITKRMTRSFFTFQHYSIKEVYRAKRFAGQGGLMSKGVLSWSSNLLGSVQTSKVRDVGLL